MDVKQNSRTANVKRNIVYGILYKIVTMLLPFVTRTMLLYLVGVSSVGISTLFSSILSFLSLAELGFGSAIVYSMYKPIAENDMTTVRALLAYYKKLYRVIGTVVLGIGLLLMHFLPMLIHGEAPEGVNINVLYLIYLAQTVVSYFAAGYRQSILTANQRSDIKDKIAIFVTLIVRIAEVLVILITRNLYLYAVVALFGTILTNIITAWVTKVKYPMLFAKGDISKEQKKEIGRKITGLMGTKLNSIVVHQADTIVISAFLGLVALTEYGNYYYILNAVSGFVMILFSSMTASIGNKVATDTKENVQRLFDKISVVNAWIIGWCSICMLCLYQPFMKIWVGEELMLPFSTVILLSIYLYIFQIQRTLFTFKDACGLWYEDRFRPYVSMAINVVSNLALIKVIGINGVVISSVLAFAISLPWCNSVVFKNYFQKNPMVNMVKISKHALITAALAAITYFVCRFCADGILGFLERGLICCIVPTGIGYLLYHKTDEFHSAISMLTRGKGR